MVGSSASVQIFFFSSNDVIALTNRNDGADKLPQDQELISSRTGLTEPRSSVLSTMHHCHLSCCFCFVFLL